MEKENGEISGSVLRMGKHWCDREGRRLMYFENLFYVYDFSLQLFAKIDGKLFFLSNMSE